MKNNSRLTTIILTVLVTSMTGGLSTANAQDGADHDDLLQLFSEWREFESPPLLDGAPDYTEEQFEERYAVFQSLRARLYQMEIDDWEIPEKVDWHLVRAEMNGYDFNNEILQPWARDPAFYNSIWTGRSDVPAHEGPTHHAVIELWTYDFPLSDAEEQRLIAELSVIPPLMKQAQKNLTGNARELWAAGIRDIRAQRTKLDRLAERVAGYWQ